MVLPRPFVCTTCGRGFTRNENLKRHMKTHHSGTTAKRFTCKKCHSQFARSDVCKRHQDSCTQVTTQDPVPDGLSEESQQTDPLENDSAWQDMLQGGLDLQSSITELNSPPELERIGQSGAVPKNGQINATPDHHLQSSPSYLGEQDMVNSYFDNFHTALPILHRATFTLQTAPSPLLNAISAIGNLYDGSKIGTPRNERNQTSSDDLWRRSVKEIEKTVHEDQQRLKTPWVLQCWILCIIYGTFTGTEKNVIKARGLFRVLVDASRELQLLHQRLTLPPDPLWTTDLNLTRAPGAKLLSQKWAAYINQESLKLSVYALYFLDFHLFAAGNIRPSISSIEFEWDLPWATELWEADNANDWWSSVSQHEKDIFPETNHIFTNPGYRDQDYQAKSLLAATQALLSDTPSQRLLSILEASPYTTLCIMANLECLVRDFTRCYYQLPPNPTDPSPFHVLTQSQNAQIATALGHIWRIMKDEPCTTCDEGCSSLWHAVRISCLSVKVSMAKPDDLLVSGIVEFHPIAGLATAAHLTLGNYVKARRSGLSLEKTGLSEDGILILFDDLLKAMHEISSADHPKWEGPWTFIQGFKLLLILWRALRMSIAEIQSENDSPSTRYLKLSRQAGNVVNAVASATQLYYDGFCTFDKGLQTAIEADETAVEVDYMQWMHAVCDRRSAWEIGPAMSEVLDEISAMTTDPVSLRQ